MVSKEPNHLLTANTKSKNTLADKLPGTMTVRSVLLNRDSPDIESRLKRRRNRTHQVRFKDLEDGSSSSGNGGSAETKSRQRPAKDGDSPHPLRKPTRAAVPGWSDIGGPGTDALPGRTSVVGAVRGDMAGTIEVVAAFLARAPPHPLTPGPTRRCWAPPQTNSLTLPMARRPSNSTSTAIQTSPCLKKPQSLSSTHTRCASLGDSVGVDGDDEQDSQDECVANNHVSFHRSRDGIHPVHGERTVVERRTNGSRTNSKAAAGLLKNSRHSSPPAGQYSEPCCRSSVPCRDGPKRQGSITPSLVRRRKRLNRTVSDPGKEVSYCTTPTQTESPSPSPPPSNTQLCTTHVQTERPCPSPPMPRLAKHCTTQCQTKTPSPSPPPNEKHCTAHVQTYRRPSSAPLNEKHSTAKVQTYSQASSPPPNEKQSTAQVQTYSQASSPPPNEKQSTAQVQTYSQPSSALLNEIQSTTQLQPESSHLSPPLKENQNTTQIFIQNKSLGSTPSPNAMQGSNKTQIKSPSFCPSADQPFTTQTKTASSCASRPQNINPSSTQMQYEIPSPITSDDYATQINSVPYGALPSPTTAPPLSPRHCAEPSCPSPAKSACTIPTPPVASDPSTNSCPASTPSVTQHPIPYYTVLSPPQSLAPTAANPSPSMTMTQCPTRNYNTPVSNIATCTALSCSITTTPLTPSISPTSPPLAPTTRPNANTTCSPPTNASYAVPPTGVTPCAFVTQTALSCTSISYHTTTHPNGRQGQHSTLPPYTTLIQTVSHCNIPCQAVQSVCSASAGIAPYSSPVPKLKDFASPSTLFNVQPCTTPTKTVPLYSSTFRAAPPYTPPARAPCSTQDKRGVRLPPPPPPPPPYTPRKEANVTPGPSRLPPVVAADGEAGEKEQEKGEDVMCADSAQLCERASSLKHRAVTPPVTVMKGVHQSSTLPAKTCSKPSCLGTAQAQLGALHKMLCSGASTRPDTPRSQLPLPPSQQGCSGTRERAAAGPLTATQADTLRQVQEILGGLVSGARCKLDPSRVAEKLLSPNGPLHDIRSLQTQLHSLEGVLETSQHTIKVLLDVIQDLEKKEAERDGRHSYRTGQDIENCGTCRDCACIIYSVEHDFRLQEGQVVRTWKVGDPPEDLPQASTSQPTTPHQEDSPQPMRPPATTKKNRKKCFWFL